MRARFWWARCAGRRAGFGGNGRATAREGCLRGSGVLL
ncbi:hypothetical protein GLE_1968 [Lysobacter enzymogenes]|uniref:Uncharacterized protein n=1 Tax=Lysobacter enzymogenes TaxID=69 RepID=A0A0S2DFH0_LYSEN|nr:hypothetical protein GLE_1968 [Lysobacter enzymogenes]